MASSASGFAALTLALLGLHVSETDWDLFVASVSWKDIVALTRLGSGSACRSLAGPFVSWAQSGEVVEVPSSFGLDLRDLVVIVDAQEKMTSSSAGHTTAASSPIFKLRVGGNRRRMQAVTRAYNKGISIHLLGVRTRCN